MSLFCNFCYNCKYSHCCCRCVLFIFLQKTMNTFLLRKYYEGGSWYIFLGWVEPNTIWLTALSSSPLTVAGITETDIIFHSSSSSHSKQYNIYLSILPSLCLFVYPSQHRHPTNYSWVLKPKLRQFQILQSFGPPCLINDYARCPTKHVMICDIYRFRVVIQSQCLRVTLNLS